MSALDEYLELLGAMEPKVKEQVIKDALEATKDYQWVPNPGPQTEAYFCDADELLFGGEAGGGKSDLLFGLAVNEHDRSLILRRTAKEVPAMFERLEVILGTTVGRNMAKGWKLPGRILDIGGCELEENKQSRKGIPHSLKAWDELVDFTETQYTFINTWNRSTKPGQRCRIVATTNPPTKPEGMWVVKRWAAWLDPTHPNPAKPGELRWYTTKDGRETEVDGPGPWPVIIKGKTKMIRAKSRTFIRSALEDNPDLDRDGSYAATLQALPEAYRLAYAEGRFDVGLKDQAFQMIPTAWVRAAQDRWSERPPPGIPMCAIAADCSGGGADPMMISSRYDGWFTPLLEIPGSEIPKERAGSYAAAQLITQRRNSATIIVDMGGGYGGPMYEKLHDNEMKAVAYKGSEASVARSHDGNLGFTNRRTEIYWKFAEACNPDQPGGSFIQLPQDQELMAELCAATFQIKNGKVIMEPKEDVMKRLGRSPNKADAVVMCWSAGPTYITDGLGWDMRAESGMKKSNPKVIGSQGRVGRANRQ